MRRKAPAPEGITAASSNDRLSRGLAAAGLVRAPLLELVRTCVLVLLYLNLCAPSFIFGHGMRLRSFHERLSQCSKSFKKQREKT